MKLVAFSEAYKPYFGNSVNHYDKPWAPQVIFGGGKLIIKK